MPASRARRRSPRASAPPAGSRLIARCTSGSKSCTPRLTRLKPSSRERVDQSRRRRSAGRSRSRSRARRPCSRWKLPASASVSARELAGVRKFGVPPPRCSWTSGAVAVEQRALQRDLALEVVEVARGIAVVARDQAGAAAVEAGALAERHVDVERQRARDRVFVALAGAATRYARSPKSSRKLGAVG